jgi:hypothetical protein
MNGPIEYWHVQLPDASVATMTLDELDAAFQEGTINEGTFVLKHGEQTWATLSALLGLDEPASPTPAPVVVAYTPQPAPTQVQQAHVVAPTLYSSVAPSPMTPAANSLRPFVSEVGGLDDDDLDLGGPAFRSSSKKKKVIFGSIGAVAAVGALVAVLGSSNLTSPPAVAAASQPPPEPVAAAAPPPAPEATPAGDRFNDEQKRALLEADKAHAAQEATRAAAKAAKAPPPSRRSASGYSKTDKTTFHKGGNKYDPLNSAL